MLYAPSRLRERRNEGALIVCNCGKTTEQRAAERAARDARRQAAIQATRERREAAKAARQAKDAR